MTKKFKTVIEFNSALGGYEYKVTSNGETVNYKEMSPGSSSFRIVASESYDSFKKFADEKGLFDVYNDDPAVIARRVEHLNRWF